VLGDLPAGWKYCWDGNEVSSIEFNDWLFVSNKDVAERRLTKVIRKFEGFLDG